MRISTLLTSFTLTATFAAAADTTPANNPYTQYPSVAKTASINGFADRIYADLPACAKECVKQDTGNTPCPYWDTGCLCVMPQFNNRIASCWIANCDGAGISSARYLATSLCSTAGVWDPYWFVSPSYTTSLDKAQEAMATTTKAKRAEIPTPETSPTVNTSIVKETAAALS
ncbi:uncharacterized protein RJT20DRAFT_32183 [Scheffersomyces xylosifermentans]|uniref:uncharacterized protein n=1 Tax=Scheffersomyces xylosifermentans TaxID=1304137 RepID=UPI00315CEE1F